MPKCDFNKVARNFIEITLRHGCSHVNLLHIFRIPFPKNNSGGLLLSDTEAYLGIGQSSMIEIFVVYYFCKNLHRRCLIESLIRLCDLFTVP